MDVTLDAMRARGKDRLGRWYWRIRGPGPDGKRATLAKGRWTDEEARQHLDQYAARRTLGLPLAEPSTRRWTVAELVGAYTEDLGERLGADHPYVSTETDRLAAVSDHLGALRIESVSRAHLERYAAQRRRDPCRTGKPVARSSIAEEIAALRRAYRSCRELGRTTAETPPPPSLKAIPDDARPARRLTEAEVRRIVDASAAEAPGVWSMVTVLAWSGRRPVAVFGACLGDLARAVDDRLPRKDRLVYWRADKGGVGRGWGPVPAPALRALVHRAHELGDADPETPLWRTPTGLPWTPERIWRVFDRICKRAGVEGVQVYDLRRFAVTWILAECGGRTAVCRRYTGHRTDAIVLRYAFAPEGDAEALAETIDWTAPDLRAVEEDEP